MILRRQHFVLGLASTCIVALGACKSRTTDKSQAKDVFTTSQDGTVYVFRGGPDQVTARKCPQFAPIKEANAADVIESNLNTLCPKTDKNEKVFKTAAVRKFVMAHYEQNYIPSGVPMNEKLKGSAADAARQAEELKQAALKTREELNQNIKTREAELSTLRNYYDANPELKTPAIDSKITQLSADLTAHKESLAKLSDEQITKDAEAKRAEAWAKSYASFMDQELFTSMVDKNKLVKLTEANPLHAQLISSLVALSQYDGTKTLTGHSYGVSSANYSPDGKFVVTGSFDGTAKIWDASTGIILKTLKGHSDSVLSANFSPDGKFVVTGSWDNTTRIWDASTGKVLKTLTGHSDRVKSAYFSPDGKFVVTGSADGTAKIWDASTGKVLNTLTAPFSVNSANFSPDGKFVVAGSSGNTAKIWDASTGKILKTLSGHSDSVRSANFSPDGKFVVTGSRDWTAKIWDTSTGKVLNTLTFPTSVYSANFSPDGKFVVSGSDDRRAGIWDAATGIILKTLSGHSAEINSANFSPDGKFVVTGSDDGTAKIWDLDFIMENSF
jgi:WD40 repeat protein